MRQRPLGPAKAGGCHLQARCAEPLVGDFKALVHLAEHLRLRQPAIVKFQHRIGVAAMRNIAVAIADGEALACPCRQRTP